MPKITVSNLPIRRDEMLLMFWHQDHLEWWATVGPQDSDDCREVGSGPSPAAALGELMIALGATFDGGSVQ